MTGFYLEAGIEQPLHVGLGFPVGLFIRFRHVGGNSRHTLVPGQFITAFFRFLLQLVEGPFTHPGRRKDHHIGIPVPGAFAQGFQGTHTR